jgi:hypothetical protein
MVGPATSVGDPQHRAGGDDGRNATMALKTC